MQRRNLFHYEAPEDGGSAPIAEATAAEPAAPTESAAPAETWAPSREEWEALQSGYGQMAQYLQSLQRPGQQAEPQGFQLPPLDPWAEDFEQQLVARDQAMLEQFQGMMQQALGQYVGPLQSWAQQQQLAEGEALVEDIYHDLIQRDGELLETEDAFDLAHALGNALLSEEAERRGYGTRAAEAAIERAVGMIRARDEKIAQAAVERYKNEMAGLAGAPREPGVEGAAAQVVGGERPDSLKDIARRYAGASVLTT